MKSSAIKITAVILTIAVVAAASITGLAIAAAGGCNAAAMSESPAHPELCNGVWQAVYGDGSSVYYIVDENEAAIDTLSAENGMGLPSRYQYDPSTGIYKIQLAYEGNEVIWRLIENSGGTAVLSDENGELLTMYYIGKGDLFSYEFYSCEELRAMAKGFYESRCGSMNADYDARLSTDGSNKMIVTVRENGSAVERYTVSAVTGAGTDLSGNSVDLSPFAP